jgi:hypothetical protein
MSAFVAGWHPEYAAAARATTRYAVADFADDRPLPPAFSLAKFRYWPFDQGPVGTCWANATTQTFQIHTAADGNYQAVALSRTMTCHQGKILDGGGNPADGGSVTNGLIAMSDPPKGVGSCHEALWPYKPDRRYLAGKPPEAATADANLNRIHSVAEVDFGDGWKRAIVNGHPVAIGLWWPYGWDSAVDESGRATGIGNGRYGHDREQPRRDLPPDPLRDARPDPRLCDGRPRPARAHQGQ